MTTWGCRRVAVCLLAMVQVAACGGGPSDRVARAARGAPTVTSAHVVRRAAFSPPPVVLDRGEDRVAIVRSLLLFGRWLEWHRPDPVLVARGYASGSALARGMAAVCRAMRRERRRIVEVDAAPLDIAVRSERPDVVLFRVTEHLSRRALVDLRGHMLERVGPAVERYIVSMIRFTSDAPWRLNVVAGVGPRVEVQL